ncbi:MAG: DUF2750 domain-containing protein [Pseudomonadota bacterium]|nr:DUF2750 domain-containing protein [Pseudomonadota bacterium]
MSISSAQSAAFFKEVKEHQSVWTIRDSGGIPTSTNQDGETAMPFWSQASRAQKIIDAVPAYEGFSLSEIPLEEFTSRWLSGLKADGLKVGINWSGKAATGYDMTPDEVLGFLSIK